MYVCMNRQKIFDPYSLQAHNRDIVIAALKSHMKSVWRLSKKTDFFLMVLLSCPNRFFSTDELLCYQSVSTLRVDDEPLKINFNRVACVDNKNEIERIDQKTHFDIKNRMSDLVDLIAESKKARQTEKIKQYKNELKMITEYYKVSLYRGKNFKKFESSSRQRRKTVISAIKNSLAKIKAVDPELETVIHNHLILDDELPFFIQLIIGGLMNIVTNFAFCVRR